MPTNPDTPDTPDNGAPLDARLKQYHDAIQQEYQLAESAATSGNLDDIREKTATQFLSAVPRAVERILYLMDHAEKDTTQLAASKFVVQSALAKEGLGEAGDPLVQLLNELKANDGKKQPKTSK
jgi:hypothetical protein